MATSLSKFKLDQKSLHAITGAIQKLWQKDKKVLIQHGILFGSLVVIIFFVFFPLFFKIGDMRNQIKISQSEIELSRIKIKRMPELKSQLVAYSKQIENVQKRFLQIHDLDQLIGDISKIAAESGIVLTGSRPITDKQQTFPEPYGKKYLAAPYELIFEGNYHQFGKFLSELEQSSRLLLVRDLNIKTSGGGQLEKLQCTIQIDAFVQTPQGV